MTLMLWKSVPQDLVRSLSDCCALAIEFVRAPRIVGTLVPSSRNLATTLLAPVNVGNSDLVIEVGVGSGSITRALFARGLPSARYLGVEKRAALVDLLTRRFPDAMFLADSAANLPHILAARKCGSASCIIALLPWSLMTAKVRRSLLATITYALHPAGIFLTYTFVTNRLLPQGRNVASDFRRYFRSVECSSIVWRNLPPAVAWRCSSAFHS